MTRVVVGVGRSSVVTGGGRGVGRAIVERQLADGGAVVVIERDAGALAWTSSHRAAARIAGHVATHPTMP